MGEKFESCACVCTTAGRSLCKVHHVKVTDRERELVRMAWSMGENGNTTISDVIAAVDLAHPHTARATVFKDALTPEREARLRGYAEGASGSENEWVSDVAQELLAALDEARAARAVPVVSETLLGWAHLAAESVVSDFIPKVFAGGSFPVGSPGWAAFRESAVNLLSRVGRPPTDAVDEVRAALGRVERDRQGAAELYNREVAQHEVTRAQHEVTRMALVSAEGELAGIRELLSMECGEKDRVIEGVVRLVVKMSHVQAGFRAERTARETAESALVGLTEAARNVAMKVGTLASHEHNGVLNALDAALASTATRAATVRARYRAEAWRDFAKDISHGPAWVLDRLRTLADEAEKPKG